MSDIISTVAGGFFIFQTGAWITLIYLTVRLMVKAEQMIWRRNKLRF